MQKPVNSLQRTSKHLLNLLNTFDKDFTPNLNEMPLFRIPESLKQLQERVQRYTHERQIINIRRSELEKEMSNYSKEESEAKVNQALLKDQWQIRTVGGLTLEERYAKIRRY